jgi:hypothetical protein
MRVSFEELNTAAVPAGVCTVVFKKASIENSSSVSVADEWSTLIEVCSLEGDFCGESIFHCMFPAKAAAEKAESKRMRKDLNGCLVMMGNWIYKK